MTDLEIKEYLQKLTKEKPKHFSQIAQRNEEVKNWVFNRTCTEPDNITFSERVYLAIVSNSSICKNGNRKKFLSFNDGYGFCGRANSCLCAKESVSQSVSKSRQQFSKKQNQEINKKREQTNLGKYGVINTGQTEEAKQAHLEYYNDPRNIEKANQKYIDTCIKKYGVTNVTKNLKIKDKIKSAWREKNKNGFWVQKYPEKDLETLHNKGYLNELYDNYNPGEISDLLNVHIQSVYRYLTFHKIRVPFRSYAEEELYDFLSNELGIQGILRNKRSIIGKELDLYCPEQEIAIEYNGVYWHHEDVSHIDKYYHYNKFKLCEDKGIQLITIFSHLWESKKECIKNMLRSKFNKLDRIYARKCDIKILSGQDTKSFLSKNHIQGHTPASINLGLYHNGEIVAVMTFSKPRTGIGKKREIDTYELVRYSSVGCVVGGASKLLTTFIREYSPKTIISYSDNEWSHGNLYKTLGFTLEKEWKPSYWYYNHKQKKQYHRFQFAKFKLVKEGFDPTMTEAEIMKERGFLRIWDCGKRTWVWENKL